MKKYNSNLIRLLARSAYYQNLYARAKELPNIKIFENETDLSLTQFEFLYWLSVYNRLYQELYLGKSKYLTNKVLDNDILCDCYLIWETKQKDKKEEEKEDKKQAFNNTSKVVFS